MAVYTRLTADEINTLVNQYDIGAFENFREIEEGVENSNYFVVAGGKTYILTVYEKRVHAEDLPFFLGLIEYLSKKAIPAPAPVHDRQGNVLHKIRGKNAAIVSFLEGKSVKEINPGHCREVGTMLAKMHLAGRDFTLSRKNSMGKETWRDLFYLSFPRRRESIFQRPEDSLNISEPVAMDSRLRGNDNDMDVKIIEQVLRKIDKEWPAALPVGVIHGDLFPDNVFFTPTPPSPTGGGPGWGLSGVIDFYFACNDFMAYDLSICLNSWCFDKGWNFNREKAAAMFAGYNSVRKITPEELEYFPLLCLGSALRFLLTRTYDWLNPVQGAIVKKLDPLEYWAKLNFHMRIKSAAEYGF